MAGLSGRSVSPQHFRNLSLNIRRVVVPPHRDMEHRDTSSQQSRVHERVPFPPTDGLVGSVIQLNDTRHAPSARLAQDEIHMLADDAIESGITLALRHAPPRTNNVRQPDLAEDREPPTNSLMKHPQKRRLGHGEQRLLPFVGKLLSAARLRQGTRDEPRKRAQRSPHRTQNVLNPCRHLTSMSSD